MSVDTNFIDDVKPYARARMTTLGRRKEHYDGFNFENLSGPELDKIYHIELLEGTGDKISMDNQETRQPFVVRIFRSATNDPKALIDQVTAEAKTIVAEFLKPKNRLTQRAIKNIFFDRVLIEKLSSTNDNGIIGRIEFTALVLTDTR